MNERSEALANVPLFSYLNPDELNQVQKLFSEEVYNKGDTICRMGEDGPAPGQYGKRPGPREEEHCAYRDQSTGVER
jgi:hypothetical protein